ncbi:MULTISPECIES: ATP-grasp fold amidoligase family protein [Anaerococcus]|uniref:ATP-grasp fold amidoligase family protein n=1 Tax=Anaerococcus TaxID=165779 RepID=UPI0024333177|nr:MULTISPECIES: ATP-grasp fold amidoligase family protein [Anaerococcus]MDD7766763.1 ATP-grasp fold amidoligase family protein [Anaerococcus vaginalis]MDY6127903.1 ATP-grasp fold amidoligase family protein [Anaerococcus sp.]
MANNIINKANKYISNQEYRLRVNSKLGFYNNMNDKKFIEKMFKVTMKYPLDLENPKTFNEKLQRLKLYNRNPLYTKLVDKYKVRDYIAEKIGNEYLIPLLGVWDNPDNIDFDSLPNKFVLKCNHNSGLGMCICKDKSKLDVKEVKKELKKGLNQNYYLNGREWPYKNVPRKIIAEKYMVNDSNSNEFTDYKFFCFNGYVDCVMVCLDRNSGDPKFYFFDKEWNLKRLNKRGKEAPKDFTIKKPECIDEMFDIASKLSEGFPFVRIDLYQSYGKIYFGEMTLYPDSGFDSNILKESDVYFGNLIDLSLIKK